MPFSRPHAPPGAKRLAMACPAAYQSEYDPIRFGTSARAVFLDFPCKCRYFRFSIDSRIRSAVVSTASFCFIA
jgi:hypothetical protein